MMSLLAHIPMGQFVGGTIENCIVMFAGFYIALFRSKRIRRKVEDGTLTEQAAHAKAKKFGPLFGYLVVVAGVLRIVSDCQLFFSN